MGAPDRDIAQAKDFIAPPGYRRHRPEATLLYQLVAEHYAGFRDRRAAEGRSLPFALRYLLATRPEVVTQVLGIVYRAISAHLIRKAGLTRASAVTGAVTLIQRFGSALNLNVHFHLLVLDGAYRRDGEDRLRFVPVPAPSTEELNRLVQQIAERIGRSLERSGLISRDIENAYLAFDPSEAKASQRDKVERLARYVSRPPVATERLSLTGRGNVRYALKTPYRDGTTHVVFEPEDFIARLAALVPRPRAHLTRYHGVFAPASPDRARIVPRTRSAASSELEEVSVSDRQRAMSWAQRLKRVFAIDIEICRQCGGRLRVIASIEAPAVIERILEYLGHTAEPVDPAHPSRAPPQGDRLV